MLKMVVLPAPFGPIRPLMSPSGMANDASCTARRPRNDFEMPRTSSSAMRRLPADELDDSDDGEDPEKRRDEQQVDADVAFAAAGAEHGGRNLRGERPLHEADEGCVEEVVPLHSRSLLASAGQMPCGRNITTASRTTP